MLWYRLPTKSNLRARQVHIPDMTCPFCRGEEENASHIFIHCIQIQPIWWETMSWINLKGVHPWSIKDHFMQYSSLQVVGIRPRRWQLWVSLVHNSFGYYIADAIPFVSTPFLRQLLSMFLSSFLSKLGIIHSLTCPHTHHQNEVVERKHHDIVEFGLSLRSQPYASLPFSFWDHAFETAVYLINRLPSTLVKFDIPYTVLFQTELHY